MAHLLMAFALTFLLPLSLFFLTTTCSSHLPVAPHLPRFSGTVQLPSSHDPALSGQFGHLRGSAACFDLIQPRGFRTGHLRGSAAYLDAIRPRGFRTGHLRGSAATRRRSRLVDSFRATLGIPRPTRRRSGVASFSGGYCETSGRVFSSRASIHLAPISGGMRRFQVRPPAAWDFPTFPGFIISRRQRRFQFLQISPADLARCLYCELLATFASFSIQGTTDRAGRNLESSNPMCSLLTILSLPLDAGN